MGLSADVRRGAGFQCGGRGVLNYFPLSFFTLADKRALVREAASVDGFLGGGLIDFLGGRTQLGLGLLGIAGFDGFHHFLYWV